MPMVTLSKMQFDSTGMEFDAIDMNKELDIPTTLRMGGEGHRAICNGALS